MPNLIRSRVALSRHHLGTVGVLAPATTLDTIQAPPGTTALRVAADELALICSVGDVQSMVDAVRASAARDGGFALDLTDGWTCWRLEGDVERAFSYLSELHLPEAGVIQGDVLRVPVRAIRVGDVLDLMVPRPWDMYLRAEAIEALGAMDVTTEESHP